MSFKADLQKKISETIFSLYQVDNVIPEIQDNKTDFPGDFTIVLFPLVKLLKKNPELIGMEIGGALTAQVSDVKSFHVVKGFLNIEVSDAVFLNSLQGVPASLTNVEKKGETVMVEYSSPNTNKPLHLGHVRNNLLGFSVAKILEASGYDVIKSQIINDRGIHICKSMLAWKNEGNGETPETTGIKGDKLVGNYYVKFDQNYKKEIAELVDAGSAEDAAKKEAKSIKDASSMLLSWEKNDPETRELWSRMNYWVYQGFDETYKRLGVSFDDVMYESNTYLLGKDIIQDGLNRGIFYRNDDGSVWVDLEDSGLDKKLLLRSDGTSVYITQDLGTAVQRFKENRLSKLIYTVGNEQDYHFQVLFSTLKKLGYTWADQLYHLSYGMVELPEGKMKSREGTVVDADELMQEMYETAKEKSQELGKLEQLSAEEREQSYEIVGMGALKYFMLKIDPQKKMLFNPATSVDFEGNTGPFIQYTYARIQSLLAKAHFAETSAFDHVQLNSYEKELIMLLSNYPETVEKAANTLSPAHVANYLYEVVKSYNSFYQNNPVLNQEDENLKNFRLNLSLNAGKVIKKCLDLLGIGVVNRM